MSKNCTKEEFILIIDDNEKLCKSLCQSFDERRYLTRYALNSHDALNIYKSNPVKAVILDLKLGHENGIDVLKMLLSIKKVPIIMLTGFGTIENAVTSMKIGAYDYINKPVRFSNLFTIIKSISNIDEFQTKKVAPAENLSIEAMTTNSSMEVILNKSLKLSRSDIPILIYGESGTGKEVLADFIHFNSDRSKYDMIKINCSSFSESLLDNELFGHDKGAFTGADKVYKGVFEQSNNKTLFLDELGDMPLSIQAKILRAIQNNEIRRLGGKETIKIDVRFIASTNKDLGALIKSGIFREDLFYRLNSATLVIPPLRERKEDILYLTELFINEFAMEGSEHLIKLSENVKSLFLDHDWPGNVRELRNVIQFSIAISDGYEIDVEDLPSYLNCSLEEDREDSILRKLERNAIIKTLKENGYNKKKTAEMLSMNRATLYNKLERYEITIEKKHSIKT